MPEADEGGPEMMSFRELARRLVADGVVPRMSNQRISQLAREDPDFPKVVKIGRASAVDYRAAKPYFVGRKSRQGQRTDLKPPTAEA
ncbi:hypothetical protein NW249_34200 [Streptomyces sp. OUCMDZ-4982]|uniref:hypothetical protein n=1 Tax=Streptomyces sp. OUCMDZ-4982 TaxID=2973090 RepID=UPI00215D33D7|nr:hypothetical protein [Streptomyces sp. OUCMDZ-4982]MCR8947141.1 hypothetical protein [Streptomyces sp. OUCMDZ-4982]